MPLTGPRRESRGIHPRNQEQGEVNDLEASSRLGTAGFIISIIALIVASHGRRLCGEWRA